MAFWNASRSVVLVTEDGDEDNGLRLVAQRKANLSGRAPVERYRLEEVVLPGIVDPESGKPIVTSRMTFVEIADDVNSSDVLGPQKATKTETAETLLEALLADGDWHESDGVRSLMAAAGFPERTTQRAAKDISVESERRDFPAKTRWRLPVAPRARSEFGATADSAIRSRSQDMGAPVAPTHAELEDGATDAFECLVCGGDYQLDEERPERLRCPACVAGVLGLEPSPKDEPAHPSCRLRAGDHGLRVGATPPSPGRRLRRARRCRRATRSRRGSRGRSKRPWRRRPGRRSPRAHRGAR